MSDGYRDAAIEQERYFERLRTRLLEEEALYGEYNPETCPNVIRGGDDWCAAGGPCRAMWCEGCNAHLGPWGAWRAVVGPFCQSYAATADYPDQTMLAIAYIPVRASARRKLNAVGWSP